MSAEEQMQERFIEEALSLIDKIEEQIFELENPDSNTAAIQEIFRVMHTLKGTAAMFGFEMIGKLTHDVENVYEKIRSGQIPVDQVIIDITFECVDIIKKLAETKEITDERFKLHFNKVLESVRTISSSEKNDDVSVTFQKDTTGPFFYYIQYTPDKKIASRGLNPFYIFEDLAQIGKIKTSPENYSQPDDYKLSNENFDKRWEIYLTSDSEKSVIEENFIFFLDDEYKIIEIKINDPFNNNELINVYKKWHGTEPGKETFLKNYESLIDNKIGKKEKVDPDEKDNASKSIIPEREISSIRVTSVKLDELINLVSELVIINSQLSFIAGNINNVRLTKTVTTVEKLSKNLRDNALGLRLIPLHTISAKFRRLTRDLSKKLGKEAELVTEGMDTELDSNIISKIEGPLMHLIRNALDHGIETTEERKKQKKSEKGIVRLISFSSGPSVFIQVQDDGKGIDPVFIREKAIQKKLISENDNLTLKELYDLIFIPGFSTAQSLSEVSGRGVGMDVVKKNITDLRGEIEIDSEIGLGTSITIKLPLTLSIIETLKIRIVNLVYLIPLATVETCIRVQYSRFAEHTTKQFEYAGSFLPVIILRDEFNIYDQKPANGRIIIIRQYDKRYCLLVDEVLGDHQAVVKPLGDLHKTHEYFSGASIMGDGSLALILDTYKIFALNKEVHNIMERI